MSKSFKNVLLFEGFLLVAALASLTGIVFSNAGNEQDVLNIALILTGVIVAGILTAVLGYRTLVRETLVRRFFVSPHWIYNHEIGYARLDHIAPNDNVYGFVTFAAEALARMSYGFEVAELPESFEPSVCIDSRIFHYHTASDDPDDGIVVDAWRGVVRKVTGEDLNDESSFEDIAPFDDAGELARLLEDFITEKYYIPASQGDVI